MSIHVTVHTLSESVDINADLTWTVFELKQGIEERKGVPWTEQRLLMGTEELDDSKQLDAVARGCEDLELFLLRGMSEEKLSLLKLANSAPSEFLATAPSWVYQDRQLMMIAVRFDVDEVMIRIPDTLKLDWQFMLSAMQHNHGVEVLCYAPELCSDAAFMFRAIEYDTFALSAASDELKASGKIVMKAGKRDWRAFQFAALALKSNPKFAAAAIKVDWRASKFFPDLLKDRSAALELVRCNGRVLELLPDELQEDPELALVALENDGSAFAHVASTLLLDQDFVLAATKIDRRVLTEARTLTKDHGFARKVLEEVPLALEQLSCSAHAKDRELVMCAVQHDGTALKFASGDLQDDRHIVLAAVRSNWRALQFASRRCRGDQEIVGEATKQSSCVIKCI